MLSENVKNAALSYLKDIRDNLDVFEKELDNINNKGYDECIRMTLIKLYSRSRILVEDIDCAKVWN